MKTIHLFVVAWIAILIFAGAAPAADTTPPVVQSIAPPPSATVNNLAQVTITFSENITGLAAADLLVNGAPATGFSGSTNRFTFTFTQPAPGLVQFTWDGSHGISDLAGNRFNETAPGANWSYN